MHTFIKPYIATIIPVFVHSRSEHDIVNSFRGSEVPFDIVLYFLVISHCKISPIQMQPTDHGRPTFIHITANNHKATVCNKKVHEEYFFYVSIDFD